MKFNKRLTKIIDKYQKDISPEFWFNYKACKKLLNDLINIRSQTPCVSFGVKSDEKKDDEYDEDTCCICLQDDNLMKTFCCNNYIHHLCLFRVLTSSNASCPICRADIHKVLAYKNEHDYYNAKVISFVSIIQLNITRIEELIKLKVIKEKHIDIFTNYNQIAVLKICKKIDKNLHINSKQYFQEYMKKSNILPEVARPKPRGLFECILNFIQS